MPRRRERGGVPRAVTSQPVRSADLRLRHHVSSQHVSLESGGAARATSYFVAMGPTGPDHWGVYRDRLVRTGGVWLFAERRVTIEGADPGGWVGSGAAPVPFTRA